MCVGIPGCVDIRIELCVMYRSIESRIESRLHYLLLGLGEETCCIALSSCIALISCIAF